MLSEISKDKIIDWSPVDRAVEKVIAKHEMIFALDMMSMEKEPKELEARCWHFYSKAMRMNSILARYKQKIFAIGQSKSNVTRSTTYRIDGKGGFFSAEHVVKLLNEAGIKAELT